MVCIVVIGASEGGLEPLQCIVAALLVRSAAAIFLVRHLGSHRSVLPSLLNHSAIAAALAQDGALIQAGHGYVAPPEHHLLLEDGHVRLNHGLKVHYTRPAIEPLFVSAADDYGADVTGIVLSSRDGDGAFGLWAIREHGEAALVQRPAFKSSMPDMALAADHPEALPIEEIAQRVRASCSRCLTSLTAGNGRISRLR